MSDFFTAYGRNPALRGRMTQLGQQIFQMRQAKEEMALRKEAQALQEKQLELQKEDMFHKVIAPYYQAIANVQGVPAEVPESALKATGRPLTQDVKKTEVKAAGAMAVPRPRVAETTETRPYSVDPLGAGAGGWSEEEAEVIGKNHPLVMLRSETETGDPYHLFNVLLGVNRNSENPQKDTMAMLHGMETLEQTKLDEGAGGFIGLDLSEKPEMVNDLVVAHPNYAARVQELNPGNENAAHEAILRLAPFHKDMASLGVALDKHEDNTRQDIEKGVKPLALNIMQKRGMVNDFPYIAQASLETYKNQEKWFEVEAEGFTGYEAFKKYAITMEKLYMQKFEADRKMGETAKMDPAIEWVRKDYNTAHAAVARTFTPEQGFLDFEGNFRALDYENSFNTALSYEAIKYMWSALVNPSRIQAKSGIAYSREMLRQVNSYMYAITADGKRDRIWYEDLTDLYPVISKEELADNPVSAQWLLDLLPNSAEE